MYLESKTLEKIVENFCTVHFIHQLFSWNLSVENSRRNKKIWLGRIIQSYLRNIFQKEILCSMSSL